MANGLQTLLAALAGAGQGASSWVDERRTRQRQDVADALAQENMRRQWEMLTRQEKRDEVLQNQAEARENRLADVAEQNITQDSYNKLIPSAPAIKVGDQELLGPQRGSEVPRPSASRYEKYGLPLQGGELTGVRPGGAAPPLTLPPSLKLPDTPGPPVQAQAPPLSLPSQRLGTPDFNPLTRPASGTDLQNRLQQAQTQFSIKDAVRKSLEPLRPTPVQTVDDSGNPVTRFVTPTEGQEFRRPVPRAASTGSTPPTTSGTVGSSDLAHMAAASPTVLQGLTPTIRGKILNDIAADPELRQQFEETRLAPVRSQAKTLLGAVNNLVTADPQGNVALTPGARAILGEYTPAALRGIMPTPEASFKDQTDAAASLRQVVGQQIVDLMATMKSQSQTGATGFGQLSIRELDVLQSAATKLTGRISETEGLKELATIQEKLSKILAPAPDATPQSNDQGLSLDADQAERVYQAWKARQGR